MKVGELIKKLNQLDPNLEVYCYEEGPVSIPPNYPGPFDIVDISSAQVVVSRDDSGKPQIKFESSETSRVIAIIGITPDF